jgi:TetR/AcrR family transcriptional regulator, mexCD-oprJ operon repressor
MSTDFRRKRPEPQAVSSEAGSPARRRALRDRTAAAILDAAAHLLAERGEAPMAEVAIAAGVGRTTLYRYFPAREALLEALAEAALAEAAERLAGAGLEDCPVEEALARVFRALLAVGDRYIVLVREQVPLDRDALERELGGPILAVLERGQRTGLLAGDVPLPWQLELVGGALTAGLRLVSEQRLGLEQASALATRFFLDGVRA